jgi:TPR repeat protein
MRLLKLLLFLFVFAAGPAIAGPFEDATAAFNKGDYEAAMRLIRPLAEQGNVEAQFNLGVMYAQGKGVPQDYAQAAAWYRKAADQSDVRAQNNLGLMYDKGQGVPQDYAEAAAWYRKAADQGFAYAQHNLGALYRDGRGVPQDYVQAHMWLNLAAARFDASEKELRDRAAERRDQVAAKMTPAQIAEAQKLAREWKPKPQR